MDDLADQGALPGPASAPGLEVKIPLEGSKTINAVAFIRNRVVVSTRDRVQVMQADDPTQVVHGTNFGAHGLATNGFDSLAAPAGASGLYCMRLFGGTNYRHAFIAHPSNNIYFYRTTMLGRDRDGTDWFVSACRDAGVLVTPIKRSPGNTSFDQFEGPTLGGRTIPFDVLDVCPLNLSRHPFGAIFLTAAGHVHFSFDIRQGISTFQQLDLGDETPYAVHSDQGHLFVATDDGVHIFQDLVGLVASQNPGGEKYHHYFMNLDVVWSTIVRGYLYVITGSSVIMCDIGHFDSRIDLASTGRKELPSADSDLIQFLGSRTSRNEEGVYRPSTGGLGIGMTMTA